MGSPQEQPHPLEALYRARDALQEATARQLRSDLLKQDLPSFGWTLRAVLDATSEFAGVLGDQIDALDRDRLYRGTLGDHPYEVIDHALDHLLELRHTLATAIDEAERYRSGAEHVDENVRDEER